MPNHLVKASIVIAITPTEAEVFAQVPKAAEILADHAISPEDLQQHYDGLGAAFAGCFPARPDNPFDSFLDIFGDINHPHLGFELELAFPDFGQSHVLLHGEQFDVETAARLLFAIAKSALPFGFQYASADRLADGDIGGGYVLLAEEGITWHDTGSLLNQALARVRDEGADGYVLAVRDADHGLSFWDGQSTFGRLAAARVCSELDASNAALPAEQVQRAEWLALPPPLLSARAVPLRTDGGGAANLVRAPRSTRPRPS
jgi:hypothetical protein